MNHLPTRIVIYAKDIMNITGRRERTVRRIMSRIRKKYGKGKEAFITVEEFCEHTGLKEEKVQPFLTI